MLSPLLAIALALLPLHQQAPAPQDPVASEAATPGDATPALREALREHVAGRDAQLPVAQRAERRLALIRALHAVGLARDAFARGVVREVVAECREPSDAQVLWKALDTAWKCGEQREYFVAFVDAHATRPLFASTAMNVLARDPRDLTGRFAAIAEAALRDELPQARWMNHAAIRARAVAARSATLAGITGVEERVAYLARQAVGAYLPGFGPSLAPSELHDAIVEWARHELHTLAQLDPRATAEAVARADVGADLSAEVENEFRAWLARFL